MFDLRNYFLNRKFWTAGFVMTIAGLIIIFLRFSLGMKPEWLDVKVFAVYSSIFDVKLFTIVTNNISEEIGIVLLLAGLILMTLSRRRSESDKLMYLRLKSFLLSVYFNGIILLLGVFFVFGWGFMAIMAFSLFSNLIFYNVIFQILLLKERKKNGIIS